MIFKINSIVDILRFINPIDKPLVFFDIDNTLIIPADHIDLKKMILKTLIKKMFHGFLPTIGIQETVVNDIFNDPTFKVQLIEAIAPILIKTLQNQKICINAITARYPSVAQRTQGHLNSVNIDFSCSPLHDQKLDITDDGASIFYNGIIFCSRSHDKGSILIKLLSLLGHEATKIILIDDEEKHIRSVEQITKRYLIPFIGIYYNPR